MTASIWLVLCRLLQQPACQEQAGFAPSVACHGNFTPDPGGHFWFRRGGLILVQP
jgi:hypothetical protein